jgi:hypothetical protein
MDKYILPNREDIQIFEDPIKNRKINIRIPSKIGLAMLDNRRFKRESKNGEKLQQITQEMSKMQEES